MSNKINEIFKTKEGILEFIDYIKYMNSEDFEKKIFPKLNLTKIKKITDLIDIDSIQDSVVDDSGNELNMRRNPCLRYAYRKLTLTPIQILLKERCKYDIKFFARNFYEINTLTQGFIKFDLRPYQEIMLDLWLGKDVTYELDFYDPDDVDIDSPPKWRKKVNFKDVTASVVKCGRQQGKSVTAGCLLSHQLTFFENKRGGIISNKKESATELLSNAKKSYERLPFWLKQGVIKWNVNAIEFENGSRCKAYATREDAGTGDSINFLIADEYAKWSPKIVEKLTNSLIPTISSGNGIIIYISTTYGDNHYKTLWKESIDFITSDGKSGNGIIPFEFTYREIPERNTKAWVEKQIRILGGKENFAQENCGKFLAVSGTLINGYKLSMIKDMLPIEDDYILTNLQEYAQYVSIYNKPEQNHVYIIDVDPNESNGENHKDKLKPDAMGIQILDVTNIETGWKQVGTVYIPGDSPIHYLELAPISYFLCKYYNDGVLFLENNISGKEIGNKIYNDYLYEKVFSEKPGIFGYRLKTNKLMLCKMLKFVIENDLLLLQDALTIQQLKSFIKKGASYAAMLGYEDDLITSLLGAILILLLDSNKIEEYFPEGFEPPNKSTILEKAYILNPTKNEQFEVMCDLIFKIDTEVKSEWEKLFDESNFILRPVETETIKNPLDGAFF